MNPIPRPPAPPDAIRETPVVVAVCGPEGCGKSWLIRCVLPRLTVAGVKTAVIKRESRPLDPSGPDRYSTPFRQAGASAVGVFDGELSMVVRRHRITEQHLIAQFQNAGLILMEGFDRSFWPKLELVRTGYSNRPSCDLSTVLALVTDLPFPHCDVPRLPFDCQAVADFLLRYYYREIGVNVMESSSANKTVSVPEGVLRAALITVSDSIYAGTARTPPAPPPPNSWSGRLRAGVHHPAAPGPGHAVRRAHPPGRQPSGRPGGHHGRHRLLSLRLHPRGHTDVTERALPGVCEALRRAWPTCPTAPCWTAPPPVCGSGPCWSTCPAGAALPCLERLLPGLKATVEAIRQDG